MCRQCFHLRHGGRDMRVPGLSGGIRIVGGDTTDSSRPTHGMAVLGVRYRHPSVRGAVSAPRRATSGLEKSCDGCSCAVGIHRAGSRVAPAVALTHHGLLLAPVRFDTCLAPRGRCRRTYKITSTRRSANLTGRRGRTAHPERNPHATAARPAWGPGCMR